MAEETIDCAVKMQARFNLLLPVLIIVGGWILAVALWYLSRAIGLPQAAGGALTGLAILGAIAAGIYLMVASQGRVVVDGTALTVEAPLRPSVRVPLSGARTESRVWYEQKAGRPGRYVAGRILVVESGDRSVALGAGGSWLAADLDVDAPGGAIANRPSHVVEEGCFRRIAARLGVGVPEKNDTR
jgi:hypothetical protein